MKPFFVFRRISQETDFLSGMLAHGVEQAEAMRAMETMANLGHEYTLARSRDGLLAIIKRGDALYSYIVVSGFENASDANRAIARLTAEHPGETFAVMGFGPVTGGNAFYG